MRPLARNEVAVRAAGARERQNDSDWSGSGALRNW
jgi:hypothetical protein